MLFSARHWLSSPSRVTTLTLVMMGVLALSGCGDDNTKTTAAATGAGESKTAAASTAVRDTLNFGSMKDIRDINPHLYLGEMAAQGMVFEALTKNTPEGVKPWLAEKWDVSPDGRVYTFHLRHDVKFSDGTPFTADVVKKNVDAVLENATRHAWLDLINVIEKNEVVDAYTWKLTLKSPYFPTLIELGLTRPFRFIAPQCMKEGKSTLNGVSCLVGTGPWVLTDHKRNQIATFTRNEGYWGKKPLLKTINWTVVPDSQTLLLSLKNGEIQLIFGADGDQLSIDAMDALQKEGKFQVIWSHPIASRAILLNSKRPITGEAAVREAIQHAINRDAIVKNILNGRETEAKTLFSKTVPGCDVPLTPREYDPKMATEILEKDGWTMGSDGIRQKNGQPMRVTFYFNAKNAQEKTIAEAVQADLRAVGIDMPIVGEEKQSFLDRQRSGNFDLQYSLSWGAPYDPQSYLSSWRQPSHGDFQAQAGLPDKAKIDETITSLMTEGDAAKRQQMLTWVLTSIHESGVYVPISFSRIKAVYSPDLDGVGFDVTQYEIPFEAMHFKK